MDFCVNRFVIVCFGIFLNPIQADSQSGMFDLSFGTGGTVYTDCSAADDFASAVKIQSDGKILVAGFSQLPTGDFELVRYNSDGTPDATFGSDGLIIADAGSNYDECRAMELQDDGKIVLAGNWFNGTDYDVVVMRLNADGSLDNSFDVDGMVKIPVGGRSEIAYAAVVQADGRIVISGESYVADESDFFLARVHTDGSLDLAFDSDGIVLTSVLPSGEAANSVAIQSDDKIVVAGYCIAETGSWYDFALIRYNSDGSLDNSFDGDGIVVTTVDDYYDMGTSLLIQNDGKLVVSGSSSAEETDFDFAVVRYNSDGSLDNTFGVGGKVKTDIENSDDFATCSALQDDDKIVVAGYSDKGFNNDFVIVRYNNDGSLDNTFGVEGIVNNSIGTSIWSDEYATDVALQTDGKIVLTGYMRFVPDDQFLTVRYNDTGFIDLSFVDVEMNAPSISPNPSSSIVNVEWKGQKNFHLAIYNSIGDLVFEQSTDQQVEVSLPESGVYLAKIRTGESVITRKIVIQ